MTKNFSRKHIIKMNTKAIPELRSIANDKGLHDHYKPKETDLVVLLEQSSEEMPTPPPRGKGKEGRRARPVKIIPSPQEMDEFEKKRDEKEQAGGRKQAKQVP